MGPWDLPYRSPPLLFYFYWQAELSLWVDNIKCKLVFGPEGEVIAGAVVREPGKLLCSDNNWLPPSTQTPLGSWLSTRSAPCSRFGFAHQSRTVEPQSGNRLGLSFAGTLR